ncbi:MAG TPA: exostosin family protein [Nonomuraea sp.]|nr:exostosin family protein [Nonomuraea sp.]
MTAAAPFRLMLVSVSGSSTPAEAWGRGAYDALMLSAARHPHPGVSLCDEPMTADAIVFVECRDEGPFLERVRAHPLFRAHRRKCLVVSPQDIPVPVIPGLYASLRRGSFPPHWAQSFAYLHVLYPEHVPRPCEPRPYLFSFTGDVSTHPVRRRLLRLSSTDTPIIDTGDQVRRAAMRPQGPERARLIQQFADYARQSEFMLCPRGMGAGSIRLFEAMQAGRAPVILSDDWSEVPGIDWSQVAVRVPERDVDRIPELLAERRDEAAAMGERARLAWEQLFGEPHLLSTLAQRCQELTWSRAGRRARTAYLLQPEILLHYAKSRRRALARTR